jgi:hypothetical protein
VFACCMTFAAGLLYLWVQLTYSESDPLCSASITAEHVIRSLYSHLATIMENFSFFKKSGNGWCLFLVSGVPKLNVERWTLNSHIQSPMPKSNPFRKFWQPNRRSTSLSPQDITAQVESLKQKLDIAEKKIEEYERISRCIVFSVNHFCILLNM